MGDVGDYWREHKEERRAIRRHWHECPTCRAAYGTGTLTPPGCKCRNCDWIAPGKKGEDRKAAARDLQDEEFERIVREDKRRAAARRKTCRVCGKRFKSEQGRAGHERDKHPNAVMRSFEDLDAEARGKVTAEVPF